MARRSGLPSFELSGREGVSQALVVAAFLCMALLLGGASAAGISANAVLQVAAIIAIAAVLMRAGARPLAAAERQVLVLVVALALLYVVQLVPLPPGLWTALPGRDGIAADFGMLGIALPWMPLSLTPSQTIHSAVALLPPIALLLMIMRFQRPVARVAIVTLLGLMVVSLLFGVMQFSGRSANLYANSNGGSAAGFFPNSNHFATLTCLSMPLCAGLVARWRGGKDSEAVASRVFALAVLLGVVLLGLLGTAMTKSLAGLLLAVVAIAGSAAIVLSGLPRNVRLAFLGGVVLVILVGGSVIFAGMAGDFATDTRGDADLSRPGIWRTTVHAIRVFGASGSGFGSFQSVFHLFEDPARVTITFVNHAHNDLLEWVLEGGIPGVVLLVLFLIWFAVRFARIWWIDRRRDPIAQGATIAALIMLLHSLVDYPLRTGAIATIFGLCIALMARGAAGSDREEVATELPTGRHLAA